MKKYLLLVFIFFSVYLYASDGINVLKYQSKEIEYRLSGCDTLTFGCAQIKMEYPEIIFSKSKELEDSLTTIINNFLLTNMFDGGNFSTIEELRDTLFNEYVKVKDEFKDMPIGYDLIRNVKIEFDSLGIITISMFEMSFFGGAHPNSYTTYISLNAKTGEKIKLEDIFISGYESKLNDIAEKIFRKQKELSSTQNFEEEGYWFNDGKFSVSKNFGVLSEGILFFYNPYEIAPYAFGATRLVVPFYDLDGVINKDDFYKF